MDQFFHGARVTDSASGVRPIQTVASSAIGLLCTGPESEAASTASLTLGTAVANNGLTYTAVTAGSNGNKISVSYMNPNANSAALSVAVNNSAIIVSLATDNTGAITSTGAQVLAAITASAAASALVTAAATGTSTGTGVVTATASQFLSDGIDEAFPLNTPVLVAGDQALAARMGSTGTGPTALADIFTQIGATVIVVRVTAGADDTGTIANMMPGVDGSGNYTGMNAFLSAESITGVRPMLLIAPGFTSNQGLLAALSGVADKLRAHIIAEGPDTTDAAVTTYAQNFGSRRIFLVDPGVKLTDNTGNTVIHSNSATAAGLIAKVDNTLGYQWSPSNQIITGITGTTRAVDYSEADPNCRANILNQANVATIIRRNGFRLWGNRTLSADPQFQFLSVSRVDDIIALSIQKTVNDWAVDRPITKTFFKDVADEVNAYLAGLTNQGVIAGGKCYPDPSLNTPTNIAAGKVYFDYDWSPAYPAEDIEITSQIVETYLTSLTSN